MPFPLTITYSQCKLENKHELRSLLAHIWPKWRHQLNEFSKLPICNNIISKMLPVFLQHTLFTCWTAGYITRWNTCWKYRSPTYSDWCTIKNDKWMYRRYLSQGRVLDPEWVDFFYCLSKWRLFSLLNWFVIFGSWFQQDKSENFSFYKKRILCSKIY